MTVEVSNDGGTTWLTATPGQTVNFARRHANHVASDAQRYRSSDSRSSMAWSSSTSTNTSKRLHLRLPIHRRNHHGGGGHGALERNHTNGHLYSGELGLRFLVHLMQRREPQRATIHPIRAIENPDLKLLLPMLPHRTLVHLQSCAHRRLRTCTSSSIPTFQRTLNSRSTARRFGTDRGLCLVPQPHRVKTLRRVS